MSDNKRLREMESQITPGSQPVPQLHVPDVGQSQPEVERFMDSM